MARDRGSAAVSLQPCEEQALRSHIDSAAAGKKNLTNEQLVDLLLSAFPHFYSCRNRNCLIERVAKITPLPSRREGAVDEPTPVAKKRRKLDETQNVRAPASASSSDSETESDESGDDAREMSDGSRRGVNGVNRAIIGDLGDGRREVNKNAVGGGRVVNGNSRPMFSDLGGLTSVISKLEREVIVPLHQLKLLRHFRVEPTARILLHGPPGCGKTALARAIGNEAGVPFYEISAAELDSGVSGAPEERIRELFSTAYMKAPSIVFIDEIDAVTSELESLRKIIVPCPVNQLMACMDEPVKHDSDSKSSSSRHGYVLVIGATNRPDALDPALRRRFDREIFIKVPDYGARHGILSILRYNHKIDFAINFTHLIRCTQGYVAGDLVELVKEAGLAAVSRILNKRMYGSIKEPGRWVSFKDCYRQPFSDEELWNLSITIEDFVSAGRTVKPSAKMEEFSITPYANWDDVGGLELLKLEFKRRIVNCIKFPQVYQDLQLGFLSSFFLYGPSGCGKTLIVEALAKEAGANLMHIKAPRLMKLGDQSNWVVQNIFSYASTHPPCIVFFDELGVTSTCAGKYDSYGLCYLNEWLWPDFRQLIAESTDTEVSLRDVCLIGASSRPEIMNYHFYLQDHIDRVLYVPLPTPEERGVILKALARYKPIDADVDLVALGKDVACENFSGADLSALMKEAAKFAIKRQTLSRGDRMTIKDADFKSALAKISPSLSPTEVKNWELHSQNIDVRGSSVMEIEWP